MDNDDDLVRGGQGRCTEELEWNAKVFIICVLLCLAFVCAGLLTGCATQLPRGGL